MIDEQFHSPVRFSIMASLVGLDRAEFAFVRDAIGASDSTLSKQAAALEASGYLKITKGHVGKRPAPGIRSPIRAGRRSAAIWTRCARSPKPPPSTPARAPADALIH